MAANFLRNSRPVVGYLDYNGIAFARDSDFHPQPLRDGVPGVLITVGGRPVTVLAFTVTDGVVTAIRGLTAPVRLGQIVPSWVA